MPVAPDVLLPGDPGRAMAMAQALLVSPKMHNLHRGLWGYTGTTIDELGGRPLSIQSTGMGAPSAAIVIHELAELGVRNAIRVGTCGALDPSLELGDLLRVEAALGDTGVNRALSEQRRGDGRVVAPDAALTGRLEAAGAGAPVTVATTDLFYEGDGRRPRASGSPPERGPSTWRRPRSSPSGRAWGWPSRACSSSRTCSPPASARGSARRPCWTPSGGWGRRRRALAGQR